MHRSIDGRKCLAARRWALVPALIARYIVATWVAHWRRREIVVKTVVTGTKQPSNAPIAIYNFSFKNRIQYKSNEQRSLFNFLFKRLAQQLWPVPLTSNNHTKIFFFPYLQPKVVLHKIAYPKCRMKMSPKSIKTTRGDEKAKPKPTQRQRRLWKKRSSSWLYSHASPRKDHDKLKKNGDWKNRLARWVVWATQGEGRQERRLFRIQTCI